MRDGKKSYIAKLPLALQRNSGVMDEKEKDAIIKLYAHNSTPHQIRHFVSENMKLNISVETIFKVVQAPESAKSLRKYRNEYYMKIMEVPISNKRVRLDNMEEVRVKIMEDIHANDVVDAGFRENVKVLNSVFTTARNEIEGNPNMVANITINDFSEKSDEELREMRRELIDQAKRAVAQTIAKDEAIDADISS